MSDQRIVQPGLTARGELRFGNYRLAGPYGPLRVADAVIDLPRKPLALLWALANRAGEVVTKDELLATVWPRRVVTEGVISASLRDLRRALGDDARQPRFIATAHRIGYRFIAEVQDWTSPAEAETGKESRRDVPAPPPDDGMVGREAERAALQRALAKAAGGRRQFVFVTGEAGIGKSRLVESFVSSLGTSSNLPTPEGPAARDAQSPRVGHGQCIEHYGAAEPYLPILEAVTRLCRQPGGEALLALLRQHAPTWLSHLPGLADHQDPRAPQPGPGQDPAQRMLREMAEAVDAAAADRLLVLVFEDLHWSDNATVDWLAMLARRRERARLLVLATCRPVELIVNRHPLKRVKQELVARSEADEIILGRLDASDVRTYVGRRMQGMPMAAEVAAAVFRRSQGHPLFMVHMADDLQRLPTASPGSDGEGLSGGVRDLIDTHLARLAPEQLAVLEAASVAGAEFAAASVAAGLQEPVDRIEAILETLAEHQQFIDARGLAEWHDGTVCGRYGFRHDIYRDGLYRRLGAARRVRLHALIGRRLEAAFGSRCTDIAAELALHFECARDAQRAAHHLRDAGEKALQRYAYREAIELTGRGLAMLAPQTEDRANRALELRLQLTRGATLLATRGYAAPEVEATYTRVLALGMDLDDSDAIGPALSGLYNLYLTRAAFAQVGEIADRVLEIVNRRPQPVLSMLVHNVRGSALLFVGNAAASLDHVDRTLALYDAGAHRLLVATYGEDPGIACHHYAALSRWIMGFQESAERHLAAGFELVRSLDHPFGEAQMLWMEAVIALDDGDLDRADGATQRLLTLCTDHEYPVWLAGGQILRGAVLAGRGEHAEGVASTDEGLRAWQKAGILLTRPHSLAVAARVQALGGRVDRALPLVEQAIATADRTGERWYEPELHRLKGELILASSKTRPAHVGEAQASFRYAVDLARQQQARLLELRSSASLADTWLAQGRTAEARGLLTTARAGLTEGLQSRDMKRVEALLGRMPAD